MLGFFRKCMKFRKMHAIANCRYIQMKNLKIRENVYIMQHKMVKSLTINNIKINIGTLTLFGTWNNIHVALEITFVMHNKNKTIFNQLNVKLLFLSKIIWWIISLCIWRGNYKENCCNNKLFIVDINKRQMQPLLFTPGCKYSLKPLYNFQMCNQK